MSFFKKVGGIFVMGILFLSSVFAVQVQPDCAGIKDGVVICNFQKGLAYAECYDEKPLQTIGDDNTWQKNKPLWMQGLSKKELDKYSKDKVIKWQKECAPLTFQTASYPGGEVGEVLPWELPIEFLWIAVGLLLVLIIMMGIRHHKQCKEKN